MFILKFKKLEVYGFKSFADKLPVEFGEGITAIVGPNGCGKSNVADSIRWVLGEQSAKLLRGNNMQDVIFNGTEKRKSMSFSEVNLYFDNTDHQLFANMDYTEVVISRRLYRSGESQYLINGTPCRLKDITDLLRDGGMGREGYSIIGQGRIDELLSSKPEDRRTIFEEAAGISKFKSRKLESERKLVRTRDNMSRVNDILREKERQLEPLMKQAETAKKYLEFHEQLRFNEINAYIYQRETANHSKFVIGERLKGVIDEIALRQQENDQLIKDYRSIMESRETVDKDIESLRDKLVVLTVGIADKAGEIKLLNQQLSHLKENNQTLSDENMGLIALKKENENVLVNKKVELADLQVQLRQAEIDRANKNDEFLAAADELTANADEVANARREELEAIEKLTDIKSNMSRLLAERDGLNERVADFESRLKEFVAKIDELEPRAKELSNAVIKAETDKNVAVDELSKAYAKSNALAAEINELNADFDDVSNTYHTKKGQYRILYDIKTSYDSYNNSVKNLLIDAKNNKELSSKIEGVVAELINVKSKFETAIEMALGAAIQNIVVRTEDDAKYLVDHLKRNRRGRVTFLPISSVKPRDIDFRYSSFINGKGCYGKASDVIAFDPKYSRVIEGLLGGTVIVEDMDTAVSLARATGYSFKIVTLDGDIINPQGSITGGSKNDRNFSNIFTHERELKELTTTLAEIERKLSVLSAKKAELNSQKAILDNTVKELREKAHAYEVEQATKSETLSSVNVDLQQAQKDYIALKYVFDRDTARIAEITESIDSVGELEELIKTKRAVASEQNESKQKQIEELRSKHDKLRDEVTALVIKVNGLSTAADSLSADIERLESDIESSSQKISANNEQIEANKISAKEVDNKLNILAESEGESDSDKVKAVKEQLATLDEYKKNVINEISVIDEKRTKYAELLQQLNERKLNEEYQLSKVDTDIENMEQRIAEEYMLDYEGCLQFKAAEFDITQASPMINKLKRQIAALGNVNIDAIEQSKVVAEEFNNLDSQRIDLERAEEDLVKIIKELSAEMLSIFNDQFEKIRTNFVKIFKELFDGGNADLLLLESDDPLAAGVEIVAQPPQKKLQSISLLSGGEKALTAIAILFAILKLKPMPFCVLDEIEAALDDANASRFAKYLRRFSEETQFIVITHRKPTMELADNLYGVTMEEKGVSKIVSVKLSEAVQHAAEKIGA